MAGGGKRYEALARAQPSPSDFLFETRKERIAQVVAGRTRTLTVVLDRLEDTFNMAAVLRTCEGLGIQEVHVIENPEVPFEPHPKVTQGCDKWLDIRTYGGFADCRAHLKERGFSVWASAVGEGARSLRELRFDGRVALVFGNERKGVSDDVLAGADGLFWIPMRGFVQSFNISVAVSAALSRAVLWREEHLGPGGDLTPEEAAELTERFQLLSLKQRGRISSP
ncbi:MAG: RNA methyltransferase [Myxococcaceae bacterium]|nr:RNA methyltransferase [Myxococcaceae bacterium]MCI0672124.1 RNA methyltransferase [Myxococcaceae bacterium]